MAVAPPFVTLSPARFPARASVVLRDYHLEASLHYEHHDERSPVQRQIEGALDITAPPLAVFVGGVEFYFDDGVLLTGISLYAPDIAGDAEPPSPAEAAGPAMLLHFPGATAERSELAPGLSVFASCNRAARSAVIVFGARTPCRRHAIADHVLVGIDDEGRLREILFTALTIEDDGAAAVAD